MKAIVLFIALTFIYDSGYPPVYVEWVDIIATDGGWRTIDEVDEWIETELTVVRQVGFLYKETPEYIVLIDSYFDEDIVGYAVKIPKKNVIKLQKLK